MSEESKKPKIIVSKNQDFKQHYATGAQGGHSPYDFRIAFYNDSIDIEKATDQYGKPMPMEKIIINREFSVEVMLSPFGAKQLSEWLSNHIKEYEQKFGDIKPKEKPDQPPTGYI